MHFAYWATRNYAERTAQLLTEPFRSVLYDELRCAPLAAQRYRTFYAVLMCTGHRHVSNYCYVLRALPEIPGDKERGQGSELTASGGRCILHFSTVGHAEGSSCASPVQQTALQPHP